MMLMSRSFKVDDFDGGIGHFLGPVRVFDHNDIPSLEETVTRMIRPHYPESEFQVKYYSYEDLDGDSNNNDPRNIVQLDVSTLGWEEVVMELDVVRVKPFNPPQLLWVAKLHERQLCLAGCCRLCLVLF
ncbi:Hypothetical predicted protein [Prunus dulcis]|uniref:Uncharacterized protein n=1 Tax=Prunus dulcis TaxID=3755 RepID=A0A5E4GMC0_PRUDU|nr:Hypothetical predicted protein [Prunus dulcis]